jgi:hypothetical protein
METEIKDTNVESENEEVTDSTAETTGKKTTESQKTFTQADLDRVVKERLNREKKETQKLSESWETEKNELTTQLESYEKIIKSIIDAKKSDIPENFRKLLNKLSINEQFDWLNDPANKMADKKPIPITPNGSEQKSNNGAGLKLHKI